MHLLNHKKPSILRNFFLIALAQKIKIAKSTRNYNGTNIVSVRDTNWLKSLIQIRRIKHKFDTNSIDDLFHYMHFSGSWTLNRRDSHSRNCPLTLIKVYMNSWPFLISFRLILQISTWLLSIFLIKNPNRILVSSSELLNYFGRCSSISGNSTIICINSRNKWRYIGRIWNIWNRYNNKG